MAGTPRALRYPRPNFFEEQPHLGGAPTDAGQPRDGGLGVGDGGRGMAAEMLLQGGGVGGQAAGLAAVVPPADGVEAAVAVVVEAALDGGPGQAGEADQVGPGQPVGGQAEEFHPALDLRARVVVAVVLDLGEDIGREVEPTHGILPGVEGGSRRLTRDRPAGKAQFRAR